MEHEDDLDAGENDSQKDLLFTLAKKTALDIMARERTVRSVLALAPRGFALAQVPSGTYTAHFTHTLFVSGLREQIEVSPGVTTTLPLVGLWAGDLDTDGDVDQADWLVCAQASIPAGDPAFDLNADGVTDIRDCTRVLANIGRPDMPITDPPQVGLGY